MGHTPFYFESWYNVERTVTLSVVGFAALFIMLRVSGKRTLSKLNVFDFVFVVAVGSVFASMIISKDVTLVEKGRLVTLLTNRTPQKNLLQSNGHGRNGTVNAGVCERFIPEFKSPNACDLIAASPFPDSPV